MKNLSLIFLLLTAFSCQEDCKHFNFNLEEVTQIKNDLIFKRENFIENFRTLNLREVDISSDNNTTNLKKLFEKNINYRFFKQFDCANAQSILILDGINGSKELSTSKVMRENTQMSITITYPDDDSFFKAESAIDKTKFDRALNVPPFASSSKRKLVCSDYCFFDETANLSNSYIPLNKFVAETYSALSYIIHWKDQYEKEYSEYFITYKFAKPNSAKLENMNQVIRNEKVASGIKIDLHTLINKLTQTTSLSQIENITNPLNLTLEESANRDYRWHMDNVFKFRFSANQKFVNNLPLQGNSIEVIFRRKTEDDALMNGSYIQGTHVTLYAGKGIGLMEYFESLEYQFQDSKEGQILYKPDGLNVKVNNIGSSNVYFNFRKK